MKTLTGFSTVAQMASGTCVILFAPSLIGLRQQFEKIAPRGTMFNASMACQVQIQQLAPCGKFEPTHPAILSR